MELSNLYLFSDRYVSLTVQVEQTQEWEWRKPDDLWEDMMLQMGDYSGAEFPLDFRHYSGKRYDDVLGTGYPSLYLISDHFKEVLETNGFTGWKTFPVRVFTKKGEEVPGYHGFSVIGRAGGIDWSKSEVVYTKSPTGMLLDNYKGIPVDMSKWDGSDIFLPYKWYGIVMTRRVRDALLAAKVTNVLFENMAESLMSCSTIRINQKYKDTGKN